MYFNQSALNLTTTIPISESGLYVSVEQCEAYASGLNAWSLVYQICIAGILVLYFYNLYKFGCLDKEINFIKDLLKGDR